MQFWNQCQKCYPDNTKLSLMKILCWPVLFGSTKKIIDKYVPFTKIVEVVLIQYNLAGNQYQLKSEVLYTFTPKNFMLIS